MIGSPLSTAILLVGLIFCATQPSIASKIRGEDINKINEVLGIIQDKYPEHVKNETLINGAMDGMLQSLDPYSAYYGPEEYAFFKTEAAGRYGGIGIEYEKSEKFLKIIKVTKGDPADLAGIKTGDIITHVDGISTTTLSLAKAANMIRGSIGTMVKLNILRGNMPLKFTLTRQAIRPESVMHEVRDNIAIFRITGFDEQTYDQLLLGMKKTVLKDRSIVGMIIDLRNNPGGLLEAAVDVSNLFLQDYAKIVSVKTKDNFVLEEYVANDLADVTGGIPVAIVINRESASASEIVAAALRDNKRAILVGESTFGKAAVQAFIELNSVPGAAVKITIGSYYTPKDHKIDKLGIIPDIESKNPPSFELNSSVLVLPDDTQMKRAIQAVSSPEQYARLLKENVKVIAKKH